MNKFVKGFYVATLIVILLIGTIILLAIPVSKKFKEVSKSGTDNTQTSTENNTGVSVVEGDTIDAKLAKMLEDLRREQAGIEDGGNSSSKSIDDVTEDESGDGEKKPIPNPQAGNPGPSEVTWTYPEGLDITGHPILSDYEVFFIGDSIFTTNDGTGTSVSEYFSYYNGATVFNLAREGMPAGLATNNFLPLPRAIDAFMGEVETQEYGAGIFDREIYHYVHADHSGKKQIAIINCCINDYSFDGEVAGDIDDPNNYVGGLKYAVDNLKNKYPDIFIILMAPYDYTAYSRGTELNPKGNQQGTYINAMLDFANAYNIPWVDMRSKTSFADSAETLLQGDGLHPTAEGCRIIAEVLSKEIGQRVGRLPE